MIEPEENRTAQNWPKKDKAPKKLFHTYLKNQNKLYVNTFNMIDRKSGMMIKLNATVFSVVVFFSKNISKFKYGEAIMIVMVISSILSLMFALKASRPFREFVFGKKDSNKKLEENIFAVGTIKETAIEAYEKAYQELMHSQDLQVGNQVKAMYDFEKYIRSSFRYLERSYLSFSLGFVINAMLFIIGKL